MFFFVFHNSLCFVLQTLLPSPFLPEDAAQLLEKCLKNAGRSSAHVFCGSIVVSEKFIEQCVKPFEKLMLEKAEKVTFSKYMSSSTCTLYSITELRAVLDTHLQWNRAARVIFSAHKDQLWIF